MFQDHLTQCLELQAKTIVVCHTLFTMLTYFACQDKLCFTNLLIIYGFINHPPSNIGLSLALLGCAGESKDLKLEAAELLKSSSDEGC